MRPFPILPALWLTVGAPMTGHAAAYCLKQADAMHCEYPTYAACVEASNEESQCVRNPDEPIPIIGTAPFCVVSELRAECSFYEGHSCHKAAMLSTGICAKNPNY